jgi:hypothetical protein
MVGATPTRGGATMNSFGIAMRITTATFLFIVSAFSASIQLPAAAVVVCTGPGVPAGCVVRRPGAAPGLSAPGVPAAGAPGSGAPGAPAAGAPGYGAAGRGANVNGGVNRAGRR